MCLLVALAAFAAVRAQQASANASAKPPVLVELYTSEGCSDCPPADDLLNAMAEKPPADLNIIPLAFHVTYWNPCGGALPVNGPCPEAGWYDRFSDLRYTERQQQYQARFHGESIYTPQSVIDGRYQTVGNDAGRVFGLIRRAEAEPKPATVEVALNGDSAVINAHAPASAGSAKVLLAITEDGLSSDVKAGENKSRTLQHNAVVRSLVEIGKLKDGAFSRTVSLRLKNDWRRDKLHVIAFVQDGKDNVLGANTARIGAATSARR